MLDPLALERKLPKAHPCTRPHRLLIMPTTYVVSVAGPEPAWIRWNDDTNLPCFTFFQPEGTSLEKANALKERADICCGRLAIVLDVVPADECDVFSSCHGAPIQVAGRSTHYYVCEACGKPCDGMTAAELLRKKLAEQIKAPLSNA